MDLKSNISNYNDWQQYRQELFYGFRKSVAIKEREKYRDIRKLFDQIDWLFTKISIEQVKARQDRKEDLHNEQINHWRKEVDELIDILNENFVMEILLGD